jgi:hypothetical protein
MVEPEEDEEESEDETTEPETQPEAEEKANNDEIDWEEILLDGFDAGGRREEHEEREYYEPVTVRHTRPVRPPPRSDFASRAHAPAGLPRR